MSLSLNKRLTTLENTSGSGTGTTTIADVENLQTTLDTKQETLTAGDNITIVDNVISSSGGGSIHIHIHMLVSARVWRDKQITMPGALRSRSFWLLAAAGLSFLGPLVPITTKEVSWLTPPPGE